jgi:hypothetical protein
VKLVIELEDVDGAVQSTVTAVDGFDGESNAHQVGYSILKYLDSIMERKSENDNEAEVRVHS